MKKLNLLIADDSREFRNQVAEYFLNTDSINIIGEAENGNEAMRLLESLRPDVLILDLVMPELDGFGVLKQIKNKFNKDYRPYIVVVSQLHTDICINKAITDGADYYLLKPLDLSGLHEHLMLLAAEGLQTEKKDDTSTFVAATTTLAHVKRPKNSLDEKITNIFISVGIPAHIKGYQFLREAIKLAVETPDIVNSITKKLYPTIAKNFETSPSKVERAIRHAIEVACNRGKIENLNNIFGMKVFSPNEKPTNGEFIALIADKMLIEGA